MLRFLVPLLLVEYCSTLFFGGGGGGNCGCGGGCPPAPVCAPVSQCPQISCPTGGGGVYPGGYANAQPISAGGYYAPAPGAVPVSAPVQVVAPYSNANSYVSASSYPGAYIGTGGVAGPVGGGGAGAGTYITPTSGHAAIKTSSIKSKQTSSLIVVQFKQVIFF